MKIQNYSGVIGVGKTFRHAFLLPKEYKSGRDELKPVHLSATKDYLVEQHNGDVVTGIEADDALEIKAYAGWMNYLETGKFNTVVASIDKDSLFTPGLLFNFHRGEDNELKHPEVIMIDDSIGGIWLEKKGKVNECKGWGSFWLAYQMLCGDSIDCIRPYQDFGIRFGDVACYKLLSKCETQAELFQTVKKQFHTWFPDGVQFTAFTGEEVKLTTDEWIERVFQLVYMKRLKDDNTTFQSMLEGYINAEQEVA